VFDAVLLQEFAQFVLEVLFAVMFFLVVDVVEQGIDGGWAGGEDRVAALPGEGLEVRGFRFEPFRGTGF